MLFLIKKNNPFKEVFYSGFSLLELVIYLAIAAVLVTVVVNLTSTSSQSGAAEEARAEVQHNIRLSLDTISAAVRRSTGINTPTAGNSGSSLSLVMSDSQKNPTVFDISSQALRITEGLGQAQALTNSKVNVTALTFQNINNAYPAKPTVQVTITVAYNDQGRSVYQYSKTEQTTISLYAASANPSGSALVLTLNKNNGAPARLTDVYSAEMGTNKTLAVTFNHSVKVLYV